MSTGIFTHFQCGHLSVERKAHRKVRAAVREAVLVALVTRHCQAFLIANQFAKESTTGTDQTGQCGAVGGAFGLLSSTHTY